MRIREDEDQGETMADKMLEATKSSYRQFSDYVAFRDDDPIWMMTYKIFIRLIGILFFILISPFVIIGFIIAIMAVL
ncbi:MAG: hypothetical protein GYB31_11930 [Bacteroidetes bacterium]|nr:hypothetical protein [Bacteroidota bacterium]